MGAKSAIEWTDATWNPVTGCTKITRGCDHCYAERFAERWRGVSGHVYEQGFDLRQLLGHLGRPVPPKCFERCRYLHHPLRLLPAGATVCRAGFAPAEGRCLSTAHRTQLGTRETNDRLITYQAHLATADRRKPGFRRPRNDVSGGPNLDSRPPASRRGRLRFVSVARMSLVCNKERSWSTRCWTTP